MTIFTYNKINFWGKRRMCFSHMGESSCVQDLEQLVVEDVTNQLSLVSVGWRCAGCSALWIGWGNLFCVAS